MANDAKNMFLNEKGKFDYGKLNNFIEEMLRTAEWSHIVNTHTNKTDRDLLRRLDYDNLENAGCFDSSLSDNDIKNLVKEALFVSDKLIPFLTNGKDGKIIITYNYQEDGFSFDYRDTPDSIGRYFIKGVNDAPGDKPMNCDTICVVCMKANSFNKSNAVSATIITAYPANQEYLSKKVDTIQDLTNEDLSKLQRIDEKNKQRDWYSILGHLNRL